MYLPNQKAIDFPVECFVHEPDSKIQSCLYYIYEERRCQKCDEEANVKNCPCSKMC